MQPLSKDLSSAYIDNRIRMDGGENNIFDNIAKELIHDYTAGVPRQINNIATACLINAASCNLKIIDETLVNETMLEILVKK